MVTRISKVKGFSKLLGGQDLLNLFKDGHVYGIRKINGVLMIDDLGEHALMENHEMQAFETIMRDGTYLYTKEEYERRIRE